jgi:hypothetical protein
MENSSCADCNDECIFVPGGNQTSCFVSLLKLSYIRGYKTNMYTTNQEKVPQLIVQNVVQLTNRFCNTWRSGKEETGFSLNVV